MNGNLLVLGGMLASLVLCLPLSTLAQAAEARPPNLADFAWMEGSWRGHTEDANRFVVEQQWMAAQGGAMMGMFRLLDPNRDKRVLVLEFLTLRETPDGVEMRLRHFDTALTAWEKGDPIILKLVELAGLQAVFENPVHNSPKRTTMTRVGNDGFRVRSEIIDDAGQSRFIAVSVQRIGAQSSPAADSPLRVLRKSVVVAAPRDRVWPAFTTADGLAGWAAAAAKVEMRIGGAFELYFRPDAPVGSRGMEGTRILSYAPLEMISYSGVPQCAAVRERGETPWIVWRFEAVDERRTRIHFAGFGWGEGEECDAVFARFDSAMDGVMERLRRLFGEAGPR